MPQRAKRSNKKKKKGSKKKAAIPLQLAGTASTTSHQDGITNINNNRNNNNDVTASAVNNTTSSAVALRHVVNEDDDMDRILRWLKRGTAKIDTRRMKKYMPATVNDLRSGTCNPETLADTLANFVSEKTKGDDEIPTQWLVEQILSSIPDHDLDSEEYDDIAVEMEEDLHQKIVKEFRRDDPLPRKTKLFKNCLDCLCRSWARRFDDRFYDGVKGSFLRNCTVYHEESLTFASLMLEAELEELKRLFALRTAAFFFAVGLDREEDTCWQCGAIKPDVQMCSKCKVARFCGNECMTVAWLSWHRKLWRQIRDEYKQYRDSIKSFEDAHVLGVLPCGFELNHSFDFSVASNSSHLSFMHFKINAGGTKLRGPNMKYFYKNLQRVVQGEWWLWSSTQDDQAERDSSVYQYVGTLLAYDYHGFAESINTNPDTLTVNTMIERGYIGLEGISICLDISAKDFLSEYSKSKGRVPSCGKMGLREGMEARARKELREKYQAGTFGENRHLWETRPKKMSNSDYKK